MKEEAQLLGVTGDCEFSLLGRELVHQREDGVLVGVEERLESAVITQLVGLVQHASLILVAGRLSCCGRGDDRGVHVSGLR